MMMIIPMGLRMLQFGTIRRQRALARLLLFCINQAKLICRWLPNGVLAALCNFLFCHCPGTLASGLLSTKVHGVQASPPHLTSIPRFDWKWSLSFTVATAAVCLLSDFMHFAAYNKKSIKCSHTHTHTCS